MKISRSFKYISLVFAVFLTALVLFGTDAKKNADLQRNSDILLLSEDGERVSIVENGNSSYVIIFSATDSTSKDADVAKDLSAKMRAQYGVNVRYKADNTAASTDCEILIGQTNREVSKIYLDQLEAITKTAKDALVYIIAEQGGSLVCIASCDEAYVKAYDALLSLLGEDEFSVERGMMISFFMSREDYEAEVRRREEEQRLEKIEYLKDAIGAFDDSLFGEREPMPEDEYNDPYTYPVEGQHPRLNLTSDMLPEILEVLNDPTYADLAEDFWEMANSDCDGILPDVSTLEVTYNWNGTVLGRIEAKALAYLLTGNELYGYEAIYAIKNHMLTLTLTHDIFVDIFRMYGWSMMVAGEVYDWCYDLMTDLDRDQFVRGVQKYYCEDCPCGLGDKMTIGYPPSGQSAVQGHGTNVALQRDYVAFAIAIFDEYPDWWDFIGGRFYQEYVPANNVFFAAGMNTQGTNCYVWGKFYAQLYSAWLVYTMSGEMPYDAGMEDVAYGLMGLRLPNGKVFQSGDGGISDSGAGQDGTNYDMYSAMYIVQALFPSEIFQRNARIMTNNYTNYAWGPASNYITPATSLIFRASAYDGEVEGEKNDDLPLVWYYGSPMGQMTVRNDWSEDAAAVFMRVSEVTGANHDHEDAGTFQIYYKGCFTSESGLYAGYGSSHHNYWHQATIAHNGLLVYNPAFSEKEGGWYSGGQEEHDGVMVVSEWLTSEKSRTGYITGYDYYYDPVTGDVDYAYLAGDISDAYSASTVEFVERRMLTVYTGDGDFPMFFTVYDYIKSTDPTFKKSFLMHTVTEPEIDGNVATYVQGNGKMVLTTLTENAVMTKIGGEGKTYWINDEKGNLNLAGNVTPSDRGKEDTTYLHDGALWGRVQIDNVGRLEDHFLNVIYVTDADNENTLTPTRFETDLVLGMQLESTVAVFSKGISKNRSALEFTTEGRGLYKYYVSGMSEGTWTVTVDGVTVAHAHTTDESGLIVFTAPAGEISIQPGRDVRPANSDDISYYTGGVIMPDDTQYFYTHGTEYVLPVLPDTKSRVFVGWYSNEISEQRIYSITPETRGPVKLYARFNYTYQEDYEETVVDVYQSTKTINGFIYMAASKPKASFKTVSEENGNTYLLWNAGEKDPQFDVQMPLTSISSSLKVVTYKIDVALDGAFAPINSNFRLRGESSQHTSTVFTTAADKTVRLGGSSSHVVTTLTEEFQTLIISVDFENSKIYAFDTNGNVMLTKDLVLASVDAHMTGLEYMRSCIYIFDWYTGTQSNVDNALRIDNISVQSGFPENANIPDPTLPNAIIYNGIDGAKLPAGTRYTYDPATVTPLPEIVISSSGKEFVGWYTSPDYTELVTEVPEGYTEQFVVYARWRMQTVEDYEGREISTDDKTNAEVGGVTYQSYTKTGSSFKTVTEENGNTYLLWTEGSADPQMFIKGSLSSLLGTETTVTYKIKLALEDGMNPMATQFRVQETSSKCFYVFTTNDKGEVLLAGDSKLKIGTLGSEFLEIIVTVDFKNATVTAYNPDGTVKTSENGTALVGVIAKPSQSEATDLVDFISYTAYNFVFYASTPTNGNALRIDDVSIASGAYSDSVSDSTTIYYSNTGNATLPDDLPYEYDPDADTYLPELGTCELGLFGGWYLDPEYTKRVTCIRAGTTGTVVLYARWLPYFAEDYEGDDFSIENPTGVTSASQNVTVGGLTYYTNGKAGASFKTEKDESGNTYLVFTKGNADPQFNKDGALSKFLGTETSFTLSFDLARRADKAFISFSIMLRVSGSNNFAIVTSDSDGNVYLGNKSSGLKIATVGVDFTRITVSMDFESGMLRAWDEGGEVLLTEDGKQAELQMSVPSASSAKTLVEWLATLTNYNFVWYAGGSSPTDATILVDNVLFCGGLPA